MVEVRPEHAAELVPAGSAVEPAATVASGIIVTHPLDRESVPAAMRSDAAVQPAESSGIKALIVACVILMMTTLPALYISVAALDFIAGGDMLESPGPMAKFFFTFALIKSDLFNLFNIIALPTLTAYFAAGSGSARNSGAAWALFTYLLLVFVVSYLPDVAAAADSDASSSQWHQKLSAINAQAIAIGDYVARVRNGALAAIAVMAGIKLARSGDQR